MKVLVINIPFLFEDKKDIKMSHCLGILQIASFLRMHHHEVLVIDAFGEGISKIIKTENYLRVGLSDEEIIEKIEKDVEVIGISVPFSHLAKIAHNLIEKIKIKFSNIPIVLGGVYPSTQPELAITSKADFVILGEGEEPMLHLIDYLQKQTHELPSWIINMNSDLKNATSYFTKNIDIFPLPARELIDFNSYLYNSPRNDANIKRRSASIITSRGCPYDCEFCSVHYVCGYKWRPYSAQRVLEEINQLVDNYKVNNLEIEDDNFTIDTGRVEEILNGIIEINKKKQYLSWQASNGLRVETLNEKLIKLFKESNCGDICIALEHGNPEMLDLMGKKLKLDNVLEVIGLFKKYQIRAYIFTINGYPGETKERFSDALRFYSRIKKIYPEIKFYSFIAQPYPNTKLFKKCVQEGYLPEDLFSNTSEISLFSTASKVWIETPDFDKAEVLMRKRKLENTIFTSKEHLKLTLNKYSGKLFRIYDKLMKNYPNSN
jgi:magnesium-protoporphyrin IX monomethyl ester (oxidative) cyclase